MKPAFEVLNFMNFQFDHQFFEDLHDRILTLLFIFQVIEANPKYQVHVFIVKLAQ